MGVDNDADLTETDVAGANAQLASTISSLPELMEKKKRIDMHTNIATALLDIIKGISCKKPIDWSK